MFAHHRGNLFMREIALWIVEGLRGLDVDAELETLGLPGQQPDVVDIVVAPHEYFLFETAGTALLQECLGRCALVNTEQPGTQWFEAALPYLRMAGVAADINAIGNAEQIRHGIDSLELRLGLLDSQRSTVADDDKPVDVVFMGSLTPRREAVLAELSDVLSQFRCKLLLFEATKPVEHDAHAGFVSGAAKLDLLARTRVILNLHRSDAVGYFEWHRALPAIANGAVILSEPSEDAAPLRPGVEFVSAATADLGSYLVGLLNNEDARESIARAAFDTLSADDSFARALERVLDRMGGRPLAPVGPASAAPRSHEHVVVMERVRRHLKPRSGSAMPIVPMLDDTAQVRFALKRTLLQQRQMLNIMAGRGVASARAGADSVSQTPSTSAGPDPDVSVVIPLYNHANWVGGAIRSAAACVGLQPEIVVVDDGSTDDSAQTVQSLMDANPTIAIRLVRHAENRGLAAARNTGFSHARSELVFLLDADNELFPQGLSRVVRTIRASDAGFAYGLLAAFGDESRLVSHLPWDVERLCRAPYIDAMALIRRSTWERIGGYSTGPGDVAYGWEDYQFWLGCAHAGISGQLTPELIGRYRVRHGSMLSVTNVDTRETMHYFRHAYPELPWPGIN